jgi:hypothetical protein
LLCNGSFSLLFGKSVLVKISWIVNNCFNLKVLTFFILNYKHLNILKHLFSALETIYFILFLLFLETRETKLAMFTIQRNNVSGTLTFCTNIRLHFYFKYMIFKRVYLFYFSLVYCHPFVQISFDNRINFVLHKLNSFITKKDSD